jgi:3-oxoacyl-[acyl-carrier protein] reductase
MTRYILVTGGSSGIGKAIIERSVQDGLAPICVSRRPYKGPCEKEVISIPCDLLKSDAVRKLSAYLHESSLIPKVLINNAGLVYAKPLHDLTEQEIEDEITLNLKVPILLSQAFIKMQCGGLAQAPTPSCIVNISSIVALSISKDPVYGATKAAITGLTRCLATSYAPNIRVNAVAPGFIPSTEMGSQIPADRAKSYAENSLTKKELKPETIADMVSYLISDKAENITGVTYEIANGTYLR